VITNDPAFVPTEQPTDDLTPPAAPSGLAATPGAAQVALAWTNPGSDVVSVVVRYRTDGRYPTSPADGFPVVSRSATPGAPESFVHTGLLNGTSYEYGVFAVDAAGNASAAVQVQATPVDNQPPPTVGSAWRTDKH
jgi:chitodextrinase